MVVAGTLLMVLGVVTPAEAAPKAEPAPDGDAAPARVEPADRAPQKARRAHEDGVCNTGELCVWYLSGRQGSFVDYWWGANDMAADVFLSAGAGQGQVVANNAESAWNYDSTYTAILCTEAYHTGNCILIPPNSGRDFGPGYLNNIESFQWI